MKKIIVCCIAFCVVSVLVSPQAGSTRIFAIPGYGRLLLQVPEAWKDELYQPGGNRPPTVIITPADGAPFKVMINVATVTPEVMRALDAETLRQMAESAAMNATAHTVEKSLEVTELTGPALQGFYFSAREKAPRKDDFLFMTQGIARLENMMLVFSVYTNAGQEAVVQAALEMLRGMTLRPGG